MSSLSRCSLRGAATLTALCLALPPMLVAQRASGVSPGSAATAVRISGSCPTFTWSGVDDASGYELAIYRLRADGSLESLLSKRIVGDARAWAPAAGECPRSGEQYAWTVRALGDEGAEAWSELMLFETAGAPSDEEVRHALDVLQRYRKGATDDPQRATAPAPAIVPAQSGTPHEANPRPRPARRQAQSTQAASGPSLQVVAAPGSFSLNLDGNLQLGGDVFRGNNPFIHTDPVGVGNLAVGINALVNSTAGVGRNTAVGFEALRYSGAAYRNTAVGASALRLNNDGRRNTAIGALALSANTGGGWNTAVGDGALASNVSSYANTAVGRNALANNTVGNNTAVGQAALYTSTSGYNNVAVGHQALFDNYDGERNVAIGTHALANNVDGTYNTALGDVAMTTNIGGSYNTALGARALHQNTVGVHNTGVGRDALSAVVDGDYNTAIGTGAGSNLQYGDNNVMLGRGANGSSAETHTIRIGGYNFQYQTYIEGIYGATATGGTAVFINSSNQLGTVISSARFKQDIRDLQGVSESLLDLRPVSFRYKDELAKGGPNPLEYGLIAEEVAEVLPELVAYGADGEPYTVRYHLLTPLLLAEVQRQDREIADLLLVLAERDRMYRREVADLRRRLDGLGRR